eukprot:TRINITY_DN29_c0_g2_i1.p2 TRINITY_DN29_c0_g2~~TRINITY_DN29_c0_g2_i1.p2  ORF type:complete len:619 (+),score=294.38 TRINITY_DN29_c0_g2_i1:100-1956(+)
MSSQEDAAVVEGQEQNPVEVPDEGAQGEGEQAQEAPVKKERKDRKPPEKVAMPDEKQFEATCAKLNTEIEALKARVKAFKPQIDAKILARDTARNKKVAAFQEQKTLSDERKSVQAARDDLNAKMLRQEQNVLSKRTQLEEQRKKSRVAEPTKVDQTIAQMEYRMNHTSLSVKEEKDMLAEIKALRASKAEFARYQELQQKAKQEQENDQATLTALRELRRERTTQLTALVSRLNAVRAVIDENKAIEAEANETITNLLAEKKQTSERITALMDKLGETRRNHAKQLRAHEDWVQYQQYLKRQAKRQAYKDREEEEKRKQAEYEKEQAEIDHWYNEKETCEALLRYLKRYLPKTTVEEKKEEESRVDPTRRGYDDDEPAFELKRDDDPNDFFKAVATGGKSAKKKAHAAKRAAKKAESKPIVICHTPDVFSQFDFIYLDAPLDVASVPKSIEQINERLAWFKTGPNPDLKKSMRREHQKKVDLEEKKAADSTESPEDSERKVNVSAVNKAEDEEQKRRVAEEHNHEVEDEQERKKNIQLATVAEEKEQQRRIEEEEAARLNEQSERLARRRASVQLMEAERDARVQELAASGLHPSITASLIAAAHPAEPASDSVDQE